MDYIGGLSEGDDLGGEHYRSRGNNPYDSNDDPTFDFSEREHLETNNGVTDRLRRRHPR